MIRIWATQILAYCPHSRALFHWQGPHVPGIDKADAERFCQENGLGYCRVVGQVIEEIPCDDKTGKPDFSRRLSFENLN